MLIFDVMQHTIIDSIARGTIYSPSGYTIYGRIYEVCNLQNIPVTSNPVALRRLGTGKVAQSRCARFRMRSYGLRSKFT